jgi:hypothetical protein
MPRPHTCATLEAAARKIDACRYDHDSDPSEPRRPFAERGNGHQRGHDRPEGDEGSSMRRPQELNGAAVEGHRRGIERVNASPADSQQIQGLRMIRSVRQGMDRERAKVLRNLADNLLLSPLLCRCFSGRRRAGKVRIPKGLRGFPKNGIGVVRLATAAGGGALRDRRRRLVGIFGRRRALPRSYNTL